MGQGFSSICTRGGSDSSTSGGGGGAIQNWFKKFNKISVAHSKPGMSEQSSSVIKKDIIPLTASNKVAPPQSFSLRIYKDAPLTVHLFDFNAKSHHGHSRSNKFQGRKKGGGFGDGGGGGENGSKRGAWGTL
ncbi:hypothetical protein Fcan01_04305 [Folsomia candida]|uniref:Uncharacterized protein n=1 Tax=Folsomia candida TaxID=158441 RepID=A0A226ESA7_FOLCA|nr:hypothetical protein Fcan01_04305 [Folsomia candida]